MNSSAAQCTGSQYNQAPEAETGLRPKSVAAGDLDGDGLQDIAASFDYTQLGFSVLRNLGAGKFAPKIDFTVPVNSITIESVYLQDLDGDGKKDVILSSALNNKIEVFKNTSSGVGEISFAPGQVFTTGGNQSRSLALADFDGDGKADIAVFRPASGEWFVQRSEDNSFYSVPFGASSDVPAPGDYDGDGKFDTAVFRPSTGNWFVQRSTVGILITNFGASGDRPIPNSFVP